MSPLIRPTPPSLSPAGDAIFTASSPRPSIAFSGASLGAGAPPARPGASVRQERRRELAATLVAAGLAKLAVAGGGVVLLGGGSAEPALLAGVGAFATVVAWRHRAR